MDVILISAKARCGKDSSANELKRLLELRGKKVLIAHYADLLKYICKTFFEWDGSKDEDGRTLLQYVGTDVIRNENPNYWVDFIIDILKLFKSEWDYVLIPDTRFPNEIERFVGHSDFKIHTLRIERPNFDSGLTEEQLNHPSETALDNYHFGWTITNDGTIDDLSQKLRDYVKRGLGE